MPEDINTKPMKLSEALERLSNPTNVQTLEALTKCLEKYAKAMTFTTLDEILGMPMGTTGCALCKLFHHTVGFHANLRHICAGCPIEAHTGRSCCADTPYPELVELRTRAVVCNRLRVTEDVKALLQDWQLVCAQEVVLLKELQIKLLTEINK